MTNFSCVKVISLLPDTGDETDPATPLDGRSGWISAEVAVSIIERDGLHTWTLIEATVPVRPLSSESEIENAESIGEAALLSFMGLTRRGLAVARLREFLPDLCAEIGSEIITAMRTYVDDSYTAPIQRRY